MSDLVAKQYFMEAPAKGSNTRWEFSNGYAVNEIGIDGNVHLVCLAGRKRVGFDARKYCHDEASAGCAPSLTENPAGCNRHCMRTCYDQESRSVWNAYLDKDDPCCIDNSEGPAIADPVFP